LGKNHSCGFREEQQVVWADDFGCTADQ
jgi:hypothetical protein